jgi:hypothetical protein
MIRLVMDYMPTFLLDPSEKHHPSSVSFISDILTCDAAEDFCRPSPSIIGTVTSQSEWAYGQSVRSHGVPIYPMIVPRDPDFNVVEVHYNTFYPFNAAFMNIGNHISDWERVAIRFENGEPTHVFLSRHSPFTHSWSGPWSEVKRKSDKFDPSLGNHFPVAVARGTHANYFPWNSEKYGSGLCACRLNLLEQRAPDFHAISLKHSIVWKPFEIHNAEKFIIFCNPWDGGKRIKCDFTGHPEREVFEKFGDRMWGFSGGKFRFSEAPRSPILQMAYYRNGIECTAYNSCSRPDWCPKLECHGRKEVARTGLNALNAFIPPVARSMATIHGLFSSIQNTNLRKKEEAMMKPNTLDQ